MADVRAVVVDDSSFMRTVITDLLERGGIEVVGEARDGQEAVDIVVDRKPDVVTMDVEMPVMDGVEAVESIMDSEPTPILMLSAHTDDDAAVTLEALNKGAVDFFSKPGDEISAGIAQFGDQLVANVRTVAQADVGHSADTPLSDPEVSVRATEFSEIPTLVIGASTGGPSVVERILTAMPRDVGFRILIIQHMPAYFTPRFADRLDDVTEYQVRESATTDWLSKGEAVVAPGDFHLEVTQDRDGALRLECTQSPPRHGVRPAIDVTMETAAATVSGPLVAAVLTGMGKDGASGVEAISAVDGTVIAQDEATSDVYGMPKRALETGCVDASLPVEELPRAILDAVRRT